VQASLLPVTDRTGGSDHRDRAVASTSPSIREARQRPGRDEPDRYGQRNQCAAETRWTRHLGRPIQREGRVAGAVTWLAARLRPLDGNAYSSCAPLIPPGAGWTWPAAIGLYGQTWCCASSRSPNRDIEEKGIPRTVAGFGERLCKLSSDIAAALADQSRQNSEGWAASRKNS